MQTKLLGTSNQGAIAASELAIDPMFLAARIVQRPLDYSGAGRVLGHYRAAGFTAAIAPAANAVLSNFRYTDAGSFAVILRVRATVAVATAVTAQRLDPLALLIARAYTVQETTNLTALTLTGNNGKMRTAPMGTCLATAAVASAAAGLTGGTKTADANPIGLVGLSGAAAVAGLGTGIGITPLIDATDNTNHPPVLAANEGLLVQWGATAGATGTVVVGVEYEWAEVIVF